jgi:hypothetical protein
MPEQKRKLKPIEQCPDGHYYNTSRSGEFCDVCGLKLDPPEDDPSEGNTALDESEWLCGLLVCIKGVNKGRGYPVKAGKNFIGSSGGMDVQITGARKIEKKNHAVIAYDSLRKTTLLLPTESRGMVYWGGSAIFEKVTLEPNKEIMLGKSVFMYMQFCNDDFDWENAEEVGLGRAEKSGYVGGITG